ncbi:hypothetical protein Micbo1qcDRAFT_196616 [Microdochium bolleyi]|uniref:Uncharacterized protein n=1 Tax=Microdochium bolleyi TaxID=196109 RepID=A0A136IY50_9PEZI|nr:hypothetical protein Micbo1qcDRAFT_196616 [Microdochium bolleyi]
MAHHQRPQQPLLPRMFLFEINDQPWFPSFLRARVQAGLTHAWTAYIPGLQPSSPAALVADTLLRVVGPDTVQRYTFIDFCSGAGGPTPHIERQLNRKLLLRAIENGSSGKGKDKHQIEGDGSHHDGPSYAEVAKQIPTSEVSPRHKAEAPADSTQDDAPSYAEAAKQTSTAGSSPSGSNKHDDLGIKNSETSDSTKDDAPSYADAAKQISTDEMSPSASSSHKKKRTNKKTKKASNGEKKTHKQESSSSSSDSEDDDLPGVDFILTDIHPHLSSWEEAARSSARLHYVASPVNAAAAPRDLVSHATSSSTTTHADSSSRSGPVPGRDTFRLFSLAFHHFDDPAARSILRDTLATSSGFGIFELQERSLSSFVTCLLFGAGVFLLGLPLYWWSPLTLFFVYAVPLIPFVLVFDGFVSSLRTRTPGEIEALLKSCGDKEFDAAGQWELRSGRERFMWPTGHMNWVICTKKEGE